MLSEKTQVILVWLTLALGTVYWVGYALLLDFFPPPPANLTTPEIVDLYAKDNMEFRIGVVLMILTGGFAVPWSTVIAIQMARLEEGVPAWGIFQFANGVLGSTLNVAPPVIWGVCAFTADRSPEATVVMHEFAFLVMFTPVTWFVVQAIPIGIVALTQKSVPYSAFPRWLGWFSLFFAPVTELGVMAQIFKTGPFAWNGLFVFWIPLTGFLFYIASICYCILGALKMQAQEHRAQLALA